MPAMGSVACGLRFLVLFAAVGSIEGRARDNSRVFGSGFFGGDGGRREGESSLSTSIATLGNLVPRFVYNVQNPETIVKIRKHFNPLVTKITVGGDYDLKNNLWTFRSDWVDTVVGGTLALKGPLLLWSKVLFLPGVYDVATRLKFTAGFNLRTGETQSNMEIALRRGPMTQRGLQLEKQFPLDGKEGHFRVAVAGSVEFPDVIGIAGVAGGMNVTEVQIGINLDRVDLLVDF